jgi:hypothetical protein
LLQKADGFRLERQGLPPRYIPPLPEEILGRRAKLKPIKIMETRIVYILNE